MIDLLSRDARRTSAGPSDRPGVGRPVVLAAVLGGLLSAAAGLGVPVAAALGGWFAADAGRYGDTREAVRVGVDAWLLAHGAPLRFGETTLTVLPLGLTLLSGYLVYRVGRWVGATSEARRDLRSALTGIGAQAGVYAVVALLVAVVAADGKAEPGLAGALLGGLLGSVVFGGAGVLVGSGHRRRMLGSLPVWARSVLTGAVATALAMLGVGFLLVGAAFVADFGSAATVLSRLHADGTGGLLYTLVGLAFVPNAALLGVAYVLGPGFLVGTGTLVSPTAVVIGPLPAFPLLAALPSAGPTPAWTTALLAVPVLVAVVVGALTVRRHEAARYEVAAATGLAAGILAAVVLTVLVGLAGGAVGPGRMADVGALPREVLTAGAVALGGGGLVGGVLGAVWVRRRQVSTPGTGGP
jgi:hypothetical protein